jgi:hypothetical protein
MTASSFDQQAWLDRIGYNGSREPTLGTLHELILAHSQAIAYESLDIMLGRTPRLDLVSLQRKRIFGGRGTHTDAPYQSNIIAARPGPNRTRPVYQFAISYSRLRDG